MADWSQSHFLQSLGWATLNSLWQMGLLWCLYLAAAHLLKLSSSRRYSFSVVSILAGWIWFTFTFIYYFQSNPVSTLGIFNGMVNEDNSILQIILLSASVAYLGLLIFPAYRLFRNWQFVQKIKKEGLMKADFNYRLYVQRIAAQLGIAKSVKIFLSELVKSPLTVGYIKPVILIPVAAMNNLSTQQVEAILLHELSHIRRYDYLVNFIVSIISTVLYFNPFVKQFMKTIEEERENCCDQMVLQYGYDKVGYASALLTLEKLSVQHPILALGATGKNFLMNRIEKIVGMEKKKGFKKNQLAGMFAALFCIVIFNSILIIRERKSFSNELFAYNSATGPLNFFDNDRESPVHSISPVLPANTPAFAQAGKQKMPVTQNIVNGFSDYTTLADVALNPYAAFEGNDMIVRVAQDDIDASLTQEEKEEVKNVVENTRQVISGLQWKEIDESIGDAMNEREKAQAREEYMKALEKNVDFKKLEQNLKATYEQNEIYRIQNKLDVALTQIKLDSLHKAYSAILVQLDKANIEACVKGNVAASPLPDQSLSEIRKSTEELRTQVRTIKALRNPKKVVRL